MKILCIGDPHIKDDEIPQAEIMIEEIIKKAKEIKPDLIVLLGDTLHTFVTVKLGPLKLAEHLFYELSLIALTYNLIGNHDRVNNKDFLSPYHPFVFAKGIKNLINVWKVEVLKIKGFVFVFVPYVSPGRFKEAINTYSGEIDISRPTCYFAHQEFNGAHMGSFVSEDGDIWEEENPLVISGHVHGFQKLQKNIIYPGTPDQKNFGESINKGLFLLKINLDETFSYKRFKLETCIRKTFKLTVKEILGKEYTPPVPNKLQMYRIEVSGTREELSALVKSRLIKNIQGLKYKLVIVQEKKEEEINIDEEGNLINSNEIETITFLDRMNSIIENNEYLSEAHSEILKSVEQLN